MDVTPLADQLDTQKKFDDYRRVNGGDSVLGLSWRQFNDVKHRKAVFATPVRNRRGRFVGCVSVDTEHGYDVLNGWDLVEVISELAQAIGREEFEYI